MRPVVFGGLFEGPVVYAACVCASCSPQVGGRWPRCRETHKIQRTGWKEEGAKQVAPALLASTGGTSAELVLFWEGKSDRDRQDRRGQARGGDGVRCELKPWQYAYSVYGGSTRCFFASFFTSQATAKRGLPLSYPKHSCSLLARLLISAPFSGERVSWRVA